MIARVDNTRRGPNGLRTGNERCACGQRATHESDGPRCERCRKLEERMGNGCANQNGGVPGYWAEPFPFHLPPRGRRTYE